MFRHNLFFSYILILLFLDIYNERNIYVMHCFLTLLHVGHVNSLVTLLLFVIRIYDLFSVMPVWKGSHACAERDEAAESNPFLPFNFISPLLKYCIHLEYLIYIMKRNWLSCDLKKVCFFPLTSAFD